MTHSTNTHVPNLRRALTAGAALSLAVALPMLSAAPASAFTPRTITAKTLDIEHPTGLIHTSKMVIDSTVQRGYVIDRRADKLISFDLSGSAVAEIARVALSSSPSDLVVNRATHQVIVGDDTANTVQVVDTTATTLNLVSTLPTGGTYAYGMAVDEASNTAYVANYLSDNVSAIDLTGAAPARVIPVGDGPSDVAVDPSTHKAYVSNTLGQSITTIDAGVAGIPRPLVGKPGALEFADGHLLVTDDVSSADVRQLQIESFTAGLVPVAVSAPLRSVDSISADPGLNLLYVGVGTDVRALRLADLSDEGYKTIADQPATWATADVARNRLYTTASSGAGATIGAYATTVIP